MSDCNLQQLDNGKWKCPDCNQKVLRVKARRNCRRTLLQLISEFDTLMEAGEDEAADELGKQIWCYELRRITEKPCGKQNTPLT